MIELIGVKFKSGGKMYSAAPGDLSPAEGSYVVVDTVHGEDCALVAQRRHTVPDGAEPEFILPVLREANEEDMKRREQRQAYLAEALRLCEERVAARQLPMRLVDVEDGVETLKLVFYFTAESRVDFRELVKDLAQAFHVRIELRQIGDRDETRLLGGIGICGREFCCKSYLNNFQPISIRMAKEQGLALNPAKISGACNRLMCCLRYESPVYEELIKLSPKVGSTVILPGPPPVRAYVMESNLITGKLRVKPENSDIPITVNRDDVERLEDSSRKMTKEDLRNPNRGTERPKPKNAEEQKPPRKPAVPKESAPKTKSQPPAAHAGTLHEEFGEQHRSQPKPPATKQPPRQTDFTEHRAPKPQNPAPANANQSPKNNPYRRTAKKKPNPPRNGSHGNPDTPKKSD